MTPKRLVAVPVLLLLLLPLVLPGLAQGAVKGPDLGRDQFGERQIRDLELIVVQNNGRLKPLDTMGREMVRFITEKGRYRGQQPLVTFLSWTFEADQWSDEPIVKIGYLPLRRELGLDPGRSYFTLRELHDNAKLMEVFHSVDDKERRSEKLNQVENQAKMAGEKIMALNDIMSGDALRVIPNPMDKTATWFNFREVAEAPFFDVAAVKQELSGVIDAFRNRDGAALSASGTRLRAQLAKVAPESMPRARVIDSEFRYNNLAPFRKAWMLYFVAFLVLLVGTFYKHPAGYALGMGLTILGFAVHVYGEILRVIAAGRPPVSNIYESMLFVSGMIMLFALIFEAVYRSRIFALTACGLGVVALVLSESLPLSNEISPLVPVLRSTKWLTFHVLTILTGYSAAFLAGGLAYVGLGAGMLGRGESPFAVRLDKFHYRVVQVTVLFLGTGIILGGVWANQSWGRYWGWDPKETWALISLLVYLVIIHGRMAGWLRRFGTNIASVIGLNMVIMTYYGVNYFLVGLHSYAGGTAFHVPGWVYAFLAAEIAFLAFAYLRISKRKRATVRRTSVPTPPAPPGAPREVGA